MLDAKEFVAHADDIKRDGYTIVKDAIEPEFIDEISEDLLRLEREFAVEPAGNEFEGARTVRIYNLLARGPVYERIPVHANVLPLVDAVIGDSCLVSSLSSISIDPGETAQPIHADDQMIPIAKPHAPIVCNTMWALTDFSEENGATRIVAGSHEADHSPTYGKHYASFPAEMVRGSVLIWVGSLWHGGGANRSDQRRVGLAMNYCAGFIRQQENQQLGIPRETTEKFPPRLQELVGYGVYNGLIGHIDKQTPSQLLLAAERPARMVWETKAG